MTTAEAVERLRPITTLRGEAHIDGEVYDDAGVLIAAELTWVRFLVLLGNDVEIVVKDQPRSRRRAKLLVA